MAQGAEQAASRLSGAAEAAGSRVAKRASKASIRAGDLGDQLGDVAETAAKRANRAGSRASDLGSQLGSRANDLGTRANELGSQVGDRVGSAHLDVGHSRPRFAKQLSGAGGRMRIRFRRSPDVLLKAQLAKTSRELAHESSDLGHAVDSLNSVIKANRKGAARGRTRLIGGLAVGAAAMYHLDGQHGRERRAATAKRVTSVFRGNRDSTV